MTILVTGSRHWTDWATIYQALRRYSRGTRLIHGDARGADHIAAHIGEALEFEVIAYPARWDHHGRSAGIRRNQLMLDREHPDIVLAFPRHDSIGTIDLIHRAERAGIPTIRHTARATT